MECGKPSYPLPVPEGGWNQVKAEIRMVAKKGAGLKKPDSIAWGKIRECSGDAPSWRKFSLG